jgi:hypothetical protein
MTPIEAVSAHTTEATVITMIVAINGRRRPRWAETVRRSDDPRPMPAKNVVKVSVLR